MLGTAQDITEQAQLNEELELARRELQRSNQELEQFAFDASHDLLEPVRIVQLLAERLGDEKGDHLGEQGQSLLASIVDTTQTMRILILDLLEYSRVAVEPVDQSLVDCNDLVQEVIELLAEPIAEKRAAITCAELPVVRGNASQLRRVFQNLICNALKYSGKSSPAIDVEAAGEGTAWRLSVADRGVAVDPRHADRIFEMFRRLEPGDTSAGSGMGLALCRRIVEAHGGRIWFEPRSGGGNIFSFTIPESYLDRG